jgi:cytochrome c
MTGVALRLFLAVGLAAVLGTAASAGDPVAGEQVFAKCKVCHAIGPGATNKVGPELNGVVGRPAGSVPGYNYSQANKTSGIVWSEDELGRYLHDPRGVVPGTKMTFAGLSKDVDVANVIAYLRRFGADGLPTE